MSTEINQDARDRFSKENEAWGRITPAERLAWTKALAMFPPTKLNVIGNWALNTALLKNTPVLFASWVGIAVNWDALGITPEVWITLQTHQS